MADSLEAGSLTAKLELDDSDFSDKLDDGKSKMEDFGDTADDKLNVAIKVDDGEVDKIDEAKSKFEDLQSTGDQPLELKADTSEAESSLGEVQGSLEGIQGMMETLGDIALFATAIESAKELISTINDAVDAFGELQNASAGAGLKAGGTPAATQAVMDVAQKLAPEVGKSPEDIAAVMSTIMGSGQSLGSISASSLMPYMNLATLPNVGMQDAARLLTLTKNGFGMGESQSSDMYAKALESSNLSAGALSSAMPKMLLASKQANIPLDQMLSMMTAENQSKGADATQTAMALFTGANKLTAPLDPMEMNAKGKMAGGSGIAKELQDEGVGLDTINNKSDSFLQKLVNLDKAGADFGKIFGARQGDLLKDIADNAQGIENFSNVLDNSQGAAQNYANTMRDTLPEAEKRFGESMNELQSTVGSEFAPLKMKLLEDGKGLIDAITQGMQTGDFSGVYTALSTLWQDVLNYFQNIDYSEVGQSILKDLEGAWNYATSMFMSSNYELTSPFTAIANIIGPTLTHVFDTLANAGIDAFNAIGSAAYQTANAISNGIVGAVKDAIDAFAELAGSADELTGGALSRSLGLTNTSITGAGGIAGTSSAGTSTPAIPGPAGAVWLTQAQIDALGNDAVGFSSSNKYQKPGVGGWFDSYPKTGMYSALGAGSEASYGPSGIDTSGAIESATKSLVLSEMYGGQKMQVAVTDPIKIDTTGIRAQGLGDAASWAWNGLTGTLGGVYNAIMNPSPDSLAGKRDTLYTPVDRDTGQTQTPDQTRQATQDTFMTLAQLGAGAELPGTVANTVLDTANKDSITQQDHGVKLSSIQQSNLKAGSTLESIDSHLGTIGANFQADANKSDTTNKSGSPIEAAIKNDANGLQGENLVWTNIQHLGESSDIAAGEVDVLKDGIFETSAGFDNFNQHLQSLGSSVESAASGMTASAQKYDASLNALTGQNGEYGCVMSEFGTWQEDNADYLFNQGYIGPSGANYDAFVTQEAARGAVHPGVDTLGENYGANQNKPATVQLGIDYSEAETGLTTIGTKASTKQVMPLSLDTEQATADLGDVSKSAETEKQMPIVLGGVSQAEALIDMLTAPEEKDIYIVTHSSSTGGVGDNGAVYGPGNYGSLDFGDSNGGISESNSSGWDTFPSYAAGDVFVPTPRLAMVGDQPGGEWIGSIAQAQARFGGQGGQGITISAPLNINAPVYGVDDLGAILAAHADGIMKAIEQNATLAQWR